MPRKDIIENPEGGTSGLTSACQLVDVTTVVAHIADNSSSASEEIIFVPLKSGGEEAYGALEPFERIDKFWKTLDKLIARDRDLLNELSKY